MPVNAAFWCIFFQFTGLGFASLAGINKNKKWILAFTCCSNISSTLVMFFAGRYDGAAVTIVCTIRSLLFLYQDKVKGNLIFWGCTAAQVIVGILAWQSRLSLLIIIAPVVLCYSNWFGNSRVIKYGTIISCLCWGTFDFINGVYIEGLRDAAEITSNCVGLVRLSRKEKKAEDLYDFS